MKTIYISRKKLEKDLEWVYDFHTENAIHWALNKYPDVKWFIYDPEEDIVKPSKRK